MRRREAITLLGACAMPCQFVARSVSAQTQSKVLRVGVVSPVSPRAASKWVAFDHRMRGLGYIEGQNLGLVSYLAQRSDAG